MTFYYLKVVKFKDLEFGDLSFWAGTLITYTRCCFACFFSFFYSRPLFTPLFIQLFYNNIFSFSVLFFFWNKQTCNFHTLNIEADTGRIVTVQEYTTGSHS